MPPAELIDAATDRPLVVGACRCWSWRGRGVPLDRLRGLVAVRRAAVATVSSGHDSQKIIMYWYAGRPQNELATSPEWTANTPHCSHGRSKIVLVAG